MKMEDRIKRKEKRWKEIQRPQRNEKLEWPKLYFDKNQKKRIELNEREEVAKKYGLLSF